MEKILKYKLIIVKGNGTPVVLRTVGDGTDLHFPRQTACR